MKAILRKKLSGLLFIRLALLAAGLSVAPPVLGATQVPVPLKPANAIQREMVVPLNTPPGLSSAERPVYVSQRAANRRAWTFAELMRGYQATGQTNAAWDEKVKALFEAYASMTSQPGTNSVAQHERALQAVPADCTDPMVKYMQTRYARTMPREERIVGLIRAHRGMMESAYMPYLKFVTGYRACQQTIAVEKWSRYWANLAQWTTISLEDLARDTNAPADDVFQAARWWINFGNNKRWGDQTWVQYNFSEVAPLLDKHWPHNGQYNHYRGLLEIQRAWDARGGGYANTVTDEGWKGFHQHMNEASQYLTGAWATVTNNEEIPFLMMKVGRGRSEDVSFVSQWFARAMQINPNYYDAAAEFSFYLEPRWNGSEGECLAFGRKCAGSEKWGGRVPLVLQKLHHSLAAYYGQAEAPEYWRRPQVWPDIRASYDKYFKINSEETDEEYVGYHHNYAKDAYLCGQYPAFIEQTKLFTRSTNYNFFGGRQTFEMMLQKAREATTDGKVEAAPPSK